MDMLNNLQELLARFQEQEDVINELTTRNLALIVERDDLLTKVESNEKLERAASRVVALENKVTRLTYDLEKSVVTNRTLEARLRDADRLNPKKLKEQNTAVKKKNMEWQTRCKHLVKDNKAYREEAALKDKDIKVLRKDRDDLVAKLVKAGYQFRQMDDCCLLYWPTAMRLSRDHGRDESLHAVLVLNSYGVGGLFTVMDGELQIPRHVQAAFDDSEPPTQAVLDFVEGWLGKIEAQGYEYTTTDLIVFSGQEEEASKKTLEHKCAISFDIEKVINELNEGSDWD